MKELTHLSLVTDKELVLELMSRFDHVVLYLDRDCTSQEDDADLIMDYQGDPIKCLGMCSELTFNINQSQFESEDDLSI